MLKYIVLIVLLVLGGASSIEVGSFAVYKYYGIKAVPFFAVPAALVWTYLVQKFYEPLRNSLVVKMGGL